MIALNINRLLEDCKKLPAGMLTTFVFLSLNFKPELYCRLVVEVILSIVVYFETTSITDLYLSSSF